MPSVQLQGWIGVCLASPYRRDSLSWNSDCHGELVVHPPRNSQQVQVVVHQPCQTMFVLLSPSDQTCCSIENELQPVRDSLSCARRPNKRPSSRQKHEPVSNWLNVQWSANTSQLTKPEETRLNRRLTHTSQNAVVTPRTQTPSLAIATKLIGSTAA